MRAVLIPVGEPPREVNLPNGGSRFMRSIRALIGTDCAERIQVTTRWEAWLDENGASAGKPVNQAATLLAQSFGWQLSLRGTTVIVGLDKAADTPADLVPHQIEVMLRKIRLSDRPGAGTRLPVLVPAAGAAGPGYAAAVPAR